MAKCLVLGADGFLGSHLVDSLLKESHHVTAFDRFPDGKPRNLDTTKKNLIVIQGDFLNRHDLEAACVEVEYVFHFISTTNPASSAKDPLIDIDTNMRMSVELFQICVDSKVKKLIFPSTGGAIYGRHSENNFREDDMAEPISPYAIGKLTIEGYLRYFKNTHGLEAVSYRISNPFGERQNIIGSQGAIPIFLNLMKQDRPLTVYGDGSMVRDFVYVKDISTMISKTFSQTNAYPIYNLGSGEAISVNSLIRILEKVTGIKAQVKYLPIRPTDVDKVVLNVRRFSKEFGFEAMTSLEEGISHTWKYVKSL
jgi:UDP-glucose 4-epimerase